MAKHELTPLKLRDGEDQIWESPDHAAASAPLGKLVVGNSDRIAKSTIGLPILPSPTFFFCEFVVANPLSCFYDQLASGLHLRFAGPALDDCPEGCCCFVLMQTF
jgi:hypothetical protein